MNSKQVTVASKCVSRNDSFCSGVVFLAYLSAYKKVLRFRRASLSGWRSPGTSILRSGPRWARHSNTRDRGGETRFNLVPLFPLQFGPRTPGNIGDRAALVCKNRPLSSVRDLGPRRCPTPKKYFYFSPISALPRNETLYGMVQRVALAPNKKPSPLSGRCIRKDL